MVFGAMGRTRVQQELAVQLQPRSDRLSSQKVVQAYKLLVPAAHQAVPASVNQPSCHYEQISRDLRASVLGPAERGQDHCQSNDQSEGVCADTRVHGAAGLGV